MSSLCRKIEMSSTGWNHDKWNASFDSRHEGARYIKTTQHIPANINAIASNIGRAIKKGGKAYGYEWRWLDERHSI